MRLLDLLRTTSLRLAMLFIALFGAASLALFGFIHWETHGFLSGRTEEWLVREQSIFALLDREELVERLAVHAAEDPYLERPFVLFGPDGTRLAGSPVALPPAAAPGQPLDFTAEWHGQAMPFRGLVRRLPSGDLILVAQDMRAMQEFDDRLTDAVAWGGLATAALGLVGALLVGLGAVRRLDAVTRAIQRTVAGDLSGRLPDYGGRGDMARLVRVVNGMLGDIERLMHEVKGVCDNIAHDLRTPLTRLLAGLERVSRRGGPPEAYKAAVDDAIGETKGVLRTFGALLRIAEVEAGARRAGFTAVDLAQVATDVVEFYEPLAEERGVSLTLAATGVARPEMPGDASLLFEAVANLVDNAIKFTPTGGCVHVETAHEAGLPGVAVSDTGPGIPPGEREHVLRRFHRTEASRSTPGNGLGLSLVAAVARLHGMGLTITDAKPGMDAKRGTDAAPGCRVALACTVIPIRTPDGMIGQASPGLRSQAVLDVARPA